MTKLLRTPAPYLSLVALCSLFSVVNAEVFISEDFETNTVKYNLYTSKAAGGGLITWSGGRVGAPRGDGTQDPNNFQNSWPDDSIEAQNSVAGSKYALKTQYKAGWADDFARNHLAVQFPESNDIYIRWYQKWSNSWVWPSDQQKFIKIRSLFEQSTDWSQDFEFHWGQNFITTNAMYSTLRGGALWVYSAREPGFEPTEVADTLNNGIGSGGADANFRFEKNKWYCVEIHLKANSTALKSDGSMTADGMHEVYVDGKLIFQDRNVLNRGTRNRGMNFAEIQHVYQISGKTNTDRPTWMDNLVVATSYIGPVDCADCRRPQPPVLVGVDP